MHIISSRPTARIARIVGCVTAACLAVLAVSSAPALAASTCEGQTFSQPFEALGDYNYYTLVQGSQFNSPSEGWRLSDGAQIVESTGPDGSRGGVLDLPAGARAVSPPVCVTLLYPSARVYVRNSESGGVVRVAVAYAVTGIVARVAGIRAQTGWSVSEPFSVLPELGGAGEETRQVRFIFTGRSGDTQLDGLYVDPWMR
jgi:hypothetical protein